MNCGHDFHAGAAIVDLQPPLGLPIMGRCRLGGIMTGRMNATGRFTPLCARAVVFDDGASIIALCSVDVMAVTYRLTSQVRADVLGRCGSGMDVTVVATHTHSAPPGYREFGFEDERADAWLHQVAECITQAVQQAHHNLRPARAVVGSALVHDIASNRRIRMPNGQLEMNFLVDDPFEGTPAGPIDPQLLVLRVDELNGAPVAIVANFACHSNILLEREHLDYCAEPFVMAMQELEASTPGLVGLHVPGAMGDINAFTYYRDRSHRGEQRMARRYLRHINDALCQAKPIAHYPIKALSSHLDVHHRSMPPAGNLRAEIDRYTLELRGAERRDDHEALWKTRRMISHREALLDYVQHHETDSTMIPLRFKLIRIGQLLLVTVPGELFVEYGLELKRASQPHLCMVVGYADDYQGYFPTESAFDEGGYETMPSIYSRAEHRAGRRYLEHAVHELSRLTAPE